MMPPNWECSGSSLLHADAAGLDRRGPFEDLALHEFSEAFRRGAVVGHEDEAGAFEFLAHRRRLHGFDGGAVEFLHDRLGRCLRQEESVPGIGLDLESLLDRGGQLRVPRRPEQHPSLLGPLGKPFEVDGTEYIAIQSGWGVDAQRILDALTTNKIGLENNVPQGGVVWVLAVKK
jgi:hypothetical protein